MIKKTMLLAMAVVAFAIPAGASASGEFLDNGSPVEGEIHETFTGWLAFDTAIGGMKCNVDPTLAITAFGGSAISPGVTTNTCTGQGVFAKCTIVGDALDSTPTATPTSTDVDVNSVVLTLTYGGAECPLPSSTMTYASVTLTPDNPDAISSYTVSGIGTLDPSNLTATTTGELEVENPGTLSLT